jgi:hypothetical protein
MSEVSDRCRIIHCKERAVGGTAWFCEEHDEQWALAAEHYRATYYFNAFGAEDPRWKRALMDFIDRITLEERNHGNAQTPHAENKNVG